MLWGGIETISTILISCLKQSVDEIPDLGQHAFVEFDAE
jgi:hypothetical protein